MVCNVPEVTNVVVVHAQQDVAQQTSITALNAIQMVNVVLVIVGIMNHLVLASQTKVIKVMNLYHHLQIPVKESKQKMNVKMQQVFYNLVIRMQV